MITNRNKIVFITSALIILICIEIFLRFAFGFGEMPLYDPSDKWEYLPKPNQEGVRLGNKYNYNSFSQRSDEVDSTKTIVLGLGDSVLYGGVQTDQDSLATSIFLGLPEFGVMDLIV